MPVVPKHSFHFHSVSADVIGNIIFQMNSNATGSDGVNLLMIQMCCPFILPFLAHVINCCLIDGTFPDSWKCANICPVPKCSEPAEIKDLRAISILPTLSKVLEKVVSLQLREFLSSHDILPELQSGFRPGHSCATALSKVVDDIILSMDQGNSSALILLDYSKAFDTINHNILLSILQYIGLSKPVLNFFKSYLTQRTQRVLLKDKYSTSLVLKSGVPQGSILGPILFSIYTSQLFNGLHCNYHIYADDTQLYHHFSSSSVDLACAQINEDLVNICERSKKHALLLNPSKSKLIVFASKSKYAFLIDKLAISINGIRLSAVNESKVLGLVVDRNLRFSGHVSKCIQRSYLGLRMLYAHRSYLSAKIKSILCNSLILSQFSHCYPVYYCCLTVVDKMRIQKVQNCCMRYITGSRKYDRISHKLSELRWLNMENRARLHSLTFYHKILLSNSPIYLRRKVTFRTDIHNLNVRSKGLISPPLHTTAIFERSFSFNIYKLYNSLDLNLKRMPLTSFRYNLKNQLLNEQCATLGSGT